MPTLYQLPPDIKWGDMYQTPDGGVFTVDSHGFLQLVYGPPPRVSKSSGGNEDGQPDSCVQIAFKYLRLALVEKLSHSQIDETLAAYEKLVPSGTVADFIRDHKTGSYFISAYNDSPASGHAFALVDGVAHNLTFDSLSRGVRVAYRIR